MNQTEDIEISESIFKVENGKTMVRRRKKWLVGLNFTLTVDRIVTGGCDQGGVQVILESSLLPGIFK